MQIHRRQSHRRQTRRSSIVLPPESPPSTVFGSRTNPPERSRLLANPPRFQFTIATDGVPDVDSINHARDAWSAMS